MALKLMEMPGVIEVELANSSLKRGKSPRVDNIPMEFLKCGSEGAHCLKIWNTKQMLVIHIPQKGKIRAEQLHDKPD